MFKLSTSLVLALVLALASVSAWAVLPTEAEAAFTSIEGMVTDILAVVWPILAAVVGGFALMKLFRKGVSKI
jgi:hypothetical protein